MKEEEVETLGCEKTKRSCGDWWWKGPKEWIRGLNLNFRLDFLILILKRPPLFMLELQNLQ